jgi:23S rRNA (guanosine2251-2'-O)-methyltransferase
VQLVLEGRVSIEAALEAGARPVHRIWAVRPGDRRFRRLRALAREAGVTIDQVEAERIEEVASGRSHGGTVALVGPRRTVSVHELLAEMGERALIVMLDGIEDPFNHGQAVRALYAAGVDGLVIRRDWESAVATVTRASAGTTELMPTATATTAHAAAQACRAAGMRVVAAIGEQDAVRLDEADLRDGVFILIGGERRGVTRSFVDEADARVRIAYGRDDAPDLGAASAAAVIGFAALRQRRETPT